MKPVIGIVGGTGKTGLQFAKFFKNKGYDVYISHYKLDKAKKIANQNDLKALTNEDLMKNCNIVFFSVQISKTAEAIRKLAPLAKPGTLISDFTSLKEMPIDAMLKYSKTGVDVIGLHPMFGPSVAVKGENIAVVPARGKKFLPWVKQVFARSNLIFTTAKEHDKLMSIVQCLVHFPSIATAMTLKKLRVDLKRAEKFSTPLYRARMETIKRILSQDPGLYGDIEMLNKNSKRVIDAFLKSSNQLGKSIKQKDMAKFTKIYEETKKYISQFQK